MQTLIDIALITSKPRMEKRRYGLHLCTSIMLVVAALAMESCGPPPTDDPLEINLRRAGENRSSLESVLRHYSEPEDSLKRRAAEFLILHMDAQYTEVTPRVEYLSQLLPTLDALNQPNINKYVDSINPLVKTEIGKHKLVRMEDLRIITAEMLIANIDTAFLAWENAPWADDLDFDIFCQYVLPYKSGYGPPQHWRSAVLDSISHIYGDTLPEDWMAAADTLLKHRRPLFRFIHRLESKSDFGARDLFEGMSGQCFEWSQLADYHLRAFAIPSVTVYSPRWATHNNAGHSWIGMIDSSGTITSHAANHLGIHVFNPMNWGLKTAKIFALPYQKNPESVAMRFEDAEANVPHRLRDPRIVDLTEQTVPTSSITVTLDDYNPQKDGEIVYLCVFGRGDIEALAWAEVESEVVTFEAMGRDVMYVPAYYQQGQYRIAGDPVMLTWEGETVAMPCDTTELHDIRIYRKYPLKPSMFRYTRPFKGMTIQTSPDSLFEAATTIDTIRRFPSPKLTVADRIRQRDRWRWETYRDTVVFTKLHSTRYLRFCAAPKTECIVGEITCYDANGMPLEASALGSKPGAENVLDGVYGETYHDPDTLGWVALDFGEEVDVAYVTFFPSHDSNAIQVGERYALYYWNDGWVQSFEQVAQHKYLDARVPKGTVYWLKNLDVGKEERIFTIDEAGEQMWW